MKKLLLLTVVLLPFVSVAQQTERFVEVRGDALYEQEVDKYQAKISVTADEYYAYEEDKVTLMDLEKTFFDVMAKNGFTRNQFKEIDEPQLPANNKQAMYVFETSSEEDFAKFYQLKNTKGTYKQEGKILYKPLLHREKIIAEALTNAQERAEMLANAIGKKLGKIISISDAYYHDYADSYYPKVGKNTYRLLVRFEVE